MPDQHSILENITCGLCTGFLVDAVSLSECLHPFCRSCLLKRLQKSNRCPTCHRDLGHDLSSAFTFDQTLQDLVYKLAPQAYWRELKSRGEFLRKATVTEAERPLILNKRLLQVSSRLCAPEERLSLALEYVSTVDAIAESSDESKDTTLQSESVSVKDRPTSATFRRYFRCPATAKIQQLRKILEMKLELSDNFCIYFLDPRLKDALNDDYELRDLAYIFAWKRDKPLQLYFTISKYPVEEEKPPVLDIEEMPELRAESPGVANTSMDPEPVVDPRLPQLGVQLNMAALENGGVHPGPIIRAFTGSDEPPKKKRRPAAKKKPLSNSALSNASGSSTSNSPFNASSPATPVTSHSQNRCTSNHHQRLGGFSGRDEFQRRYDDECYRVTGIGRVRTVASFE
ncbi:posterior sex combs protein [Aphelenchoides avenae]|nr:posterior sex combs protein [Aphelenchus avenae]